MRITFLGTGTSCGVPVIGCQCKVCQSTDPKDKRLRCSILVETDSTRILVDAGPDFRQQILPQPFRRIDAILVTHSCFVENRYPGVPQIGLHEISAGSPFTIGDIPVMPIRVMHGKLPILGFRFGTFAYITDMKYIEDDQLPLLEGVETLCVNALRFDKPHHSHQLVDDAIAFARRVGARRTLLTHMCHDVGLYEEVNKILPEGFELAFDGQVLEIK